MKKSMYLIVALLLSLGACENTGNKTTVEEDDETERLFRELEEALGVKFMPCDSTEDGFYIPYDTLMKYAKEFREALDTNR